MVWKPGECGNPKGRPKAEVAFMDQLREALKTVEKEKGKSLIKHGVERAYVEDTVLVALLKKIVPDKLDMGLLDGMRIVLVRPADTENGTKDTSQPIPR